MSAAISQTDAACREIAHRLGWDSDSVIYVHAIDRNSIAFLSRFEGHLFDVPAWTNVESYVHFRDEVRLALKVFMVARRLVS